MPDGARQREEQKKPPAPKGLALYEAAAMLTLEEEEASSCDVVNGVHETVA